MKHLLIILGSAYLATPFRMGGRSYRRVSRTPTMSGHRKTRVPFRSLTENPYSPRRRRNEDSQRIHRNMKTPQKSRTIPIPQPRRRVTQEPPFSAQNGRSPRLSITNLAGKNT